MSPVDIEQRLRDEVIPPAAEARERAVAAARAEVTRRDTRTHSRPFRAAVYAGALALATAFFGVTAPGRAAVTWLGDTMGVAEPSNHVVDSRVEPRPSELHVIAAGRAPDDARYELVVERFAEPFKVGEPPFESVMAYCLTFEWPDLRTTVPWSAACGETFPPRSGRAGKPAPGAGAAARAWDMLRPPRHTRRYMSVYGFARPAASRVRVVYRTRKGRRADARVDLVEIPDEVHRRVGSIARVNAFVAFLPWSAGRLEPALPQERPSRPSRPYEVIAYDARGRELSRVRRTNLAHAPESLRQHAEPPAP